MNNPFGIYDKSFSLLMGAIHTFPTIEKVWIFGSRALGNYKKASDIDLAILGEKVNLHTVAKLHGILNEELPIPYFVDVVDVNAVQSEELKKHIIDKGIELKIKD
ncbi:MAG: nucleotidyltransferase domain-containing protein [Flavobacteriaceae bacterium]|nr:nucleotidyltransferase domain-containing protein [Flavobacteriaceae bacterium]